MEEERLKYQNQQDEFEQNKEKGNKKVNNTLGLLPQLEQKGRITYMRKKGNQQTMKVVTIIAMVRAAFRSLLKEILAFSLMNLCISLAFST